MSYKIVEEVTRGGEQAQDLITITFRMEAELDLWWRDLLDRVMKGDPAISHDAFKFSVSGNCVEISCRRYNHQLGLTAGRNFIARANQMQDDGHFKPK